MNSTSADSFANESLYLRLRKFEHSKFNHSGSRFLPHGQLERLLTKNNIKVELEKASESSTPVPEHLVNYVSNHATRIFAILVMSGCVGKAQTLEGSGFKDKYLPIQVDGTRVTSFHLLADDPALSWFTDWNVRELGLFSDYQWCFIAPVFTKNSILEQPHNKCPLPFVSYDDANEGGSNGKIYKAQIHRDHIKDLHHNEDLTVAIKKLRAIRISTKAYEVEIDALYLARQLDDEHLVKFIAGFEVGAHHYLMFQWVDGGNLRNFWKDPSPWSPDDLIYWVVKQVKGIAKVLEKLHGFNPQRNCRHGDLKPENILVSKGRGSDRTLQITDMGSAKIHSTPTNLRPIGTITLAGTPRYQPPEIQTNISARRSRAYDIWSMGCILLEFIIWVLHGPDGLRHFETSFHAQSQPFFYIEQKHGILQPNVNQWLNHLKGTCLADSDEKCVSRALRDLLKFVRNKMLVDNDEAENDTTESVNSQRAPVPGIPEVLLTRAMSRAKQGIQQRRATITEVSDMLDRISSNKESGYFYNEKAPIDDSWEDISKPTRSTRSIQPTYRKQQQIADPELSDIWELSNDNVFTRDFFRTLTSQDMKVDFSEIQETQTPRLCDSCKKIFLSEFSFTPANSDSSCGLCLLLSTRFTNAFDGTNAPENAKFVRVGSSLATSSIATPLLSIVVGPGYSNAPSHIQRGFPTLAKSPSLTQARLFKRWLDDCDMKHEGCRGQGTPTRRPTRLIDVSSNTLKLDCSPDGSSKYIALSHPWGDARLHPPFCTQRSNIKGLEDSIDFNDLPRTFQDAVTVTRDLDIKYLWIDSLCIIQQEPGDDGDFDTESKFMEDYYGGAYCTVAATSAEGSASGFLGRRGTARQCHEFQDQDNPGSESTFYICDNIDDFTHDVEESYLTTRGWVFQERALSRRTIHFTKSQAYWECGHGVRCETMSRLFNLKSSFLSDPKFPESANEYYKGMKIEFIQHLYSRYSTLGFTHESDRAVAMLGIEKRLASVYTVNARHGILDNNFLYRSLLWQAVEKTDEKNKRSWKARKKAIQPLSKISFANGSGVPSWSWMAVMGPIKYMDAPFNQMTWNSSIKSPLQRTRVSDFKVWAMDFKQSAHSDEMIYDRPEYYKEDGTVIDGLKCVEIGCDRTKDRGSPLYYVLLVLPTNTSKGGLDNYERIGVARLHGDDLEEEKPKTEVRIV